MRDAGGQVNYRKERGRNGETAAAAFLEQRGVRILLRNYRCPFGEIDLIGKEKDTILIIEVKMRSDREQGYACEAVDMRKQYKICRIYDYFRMRYRLDEYVPVRFDVVEVDGRYDCRWIRNAFPYQY